MFLPYRIHDFAGIGGIIKQRADDFFVQEIPLYEPIGQGEHVYALVQKIGMTTFQAIHRLADALGVPSRDIGYAGMKDAHAITRQVFSIQGTTPEALMALHIPDMQVLSAARHTNKLRLGHLSANRFAIKIRQVNPTDVVKLHPIVAQLQDRGMPNYFGPQRFGRRGDNARLGAALIRADDAGLLALLLGSANPDVDDAADLRARQAYDHAELDLAMRIYPRHHGTERRVLARLIKTANPTAAGKAIDQKLRRLWISALQSELFNQVVARRIDTIDRVLGGDFAVKHENGACFPVCDAAAEQPRCDRFEISPTGPLVGYRMSLPQGEALAIEQAVLAEHALRPEDFRRAGRHKVKGARRPLRIQPANVELAGGVDEHGPHITLAFTLPAGSFATVFLRELMRTPDL